MTPLHREPNLRGHGASGLDFRMCWWFKEQGLKRSLHFGVTLVQSADSSFGSRMLKVDVCKGRLELQLVQEGKISEIVRKDRRRGAGLTVTGHVDRLHVSFGQSASRKTRRHPNPSKLLLT